MTHIFNKLNCIQLLGSSETMAETNIQVGSCEELRFSFILKVMSPSFGWL